MRDLKAKRNKAVISERSEAVSLIWIGIGACFTSLRKLHPLANGVKQSFFQIIHTKIGLKAHRWMQIAGWITLLFIQTNCINEKTDANRPDLESIEILPEVVFSVVDDKPVQFYIESRGIVEPVQKIQITPRLGGFIEEHNIVDGRSLNKGDLVLELNKEEWTLREEEAHNQYLKAKTEYDVEMKLRGGQQETNGSEDGFRITTGLADAELAWERAKLELSYTTIMAPFSGLISTKQVVTDGAYIGAGQELGILLNTRKVRIRFDVLESEIASLEEGMIAELEDPAGNTFQGVIVAISPEIDSDSKTGQAIVEADNPNGRLKSGMTVEGRVFVRSVSGKVRMPREALLERDARTLVFRLNHGEAEWIYVTPEAITTDWVIINHPDIYPGDTLAVDKHFSISHQQKVIPLMANE